MTDDRSGEPVTAEAAPADGGRLVLVAGIGRSGTSLMAGMLGRVGFHVPQPEVAADETNPKGFGEPAWVVELHRRLLSQRRIGNWDSRPAAWEAADQVADDESVLAELSGWIEEQLAAAERAGGTRDIVVKDPRTVWFLPLWAKAAERAGAATSYATMLRQPAEAISSAVTWYGDWQNNASRATSWLNIMLHTERATRAGSRVFVGYSDLLSGWSAQFDRMGKTLDLALLRDADDAARARVGELVDPSLRRSNAAVEDLELPTAVGAQLDEVWTQLAKLGELGADTGELRAKLDTAWQAYVDFYTEAEAIAQSSIYAVRPAKSKTAKSAAGGVGSSPGAPQARKAPAQAQAGVARRLARKLPESWRSRLLEAGADVRATVRRHTR